MSASDIGWELWRSFLAVARSGSLSGAARSLALTQPTIGRHVDALEQALGQPLFTRSQAGLQPTPAALALVPHAETMASAADALARIASGEAAGESGVVRLTASEIVGIEVLPPILAAFRERHPGIVIELNLSNRNEDLLRRDADIAVRMVRPVQQAIVAKRVGTVRIGLYASRAYAERHGLPDDDAGLFRHPLVGADRDPARTSGFSVAGRPVSRDLFAFRADNDAAQLAAVRAGFGIGVCQLGVARREPDLIPVLPGLLRFELDMWLAMHEDLRQSRRVRLLFDHLAEALGLYVTA